MQAEAEASKTPLSPGDGPGWTLACGHQVKLQHSWTGPEGDGPHLAFVLRPFNGAILFCPSGTTPISRNLASQKQRQ